MDSKQKQLFGVVGGSAVILAVALFLMMRSGAEPSAPGLPRTVSEPSEVQDPVVSRGKPAAAAGAGRLEGIPDEVETSADEPALAGKTKRPTKSRRKSKQKEPEAEEDASGFQPVHRGTLKPPEKGP